MIPGSSGLEKSARWFGAPGIAGGNGNAMVLITPPPVGADTHPRQAEKQMGAATALKAAFERWGAHCFHCKDWIPPQPLSQQCTRDHLRSRKDGGGDFLHNLVFACGPCNRAKGGANLISFRAELGVEYVAALEAHLTKCIQAGCR